MIHVDRNIPCPQVLLDSDEASRMIAYHSGGAIGTKQDYEDYKEVRKELITLFHGKCAYCESKIIHVASADIEHFRPKNEVLVPGRGNQRGYYWLGADWDNLLLSCEYCNCKRKQDVYDSTKPVSLGKQNQFPLSDESFRCTDHTHDWKREEPYRQLINPCIDNPEEHLYFDEDGFVKPLDPSPVMPSKGKETIEVVALQRKNLVDARKTHYLEKIKIHIAELQDLEIIHEQGVLVGMLQISESCERQIRNKLIFLKSLLEADKEYLALTRQMLTPVLAKYGTTL